MAGILAVADASGLLFGPDDFARLVLGASYTALEGGTTWEPDGTQLVVSAPTGVGFQHLEVALAARQDAYIQVQAQTHVGHAIGCYVRKSGGSLYSLMAGGTLTGGTTSQTAIFEDDTTNLVNGTDADSPYSQPRTFHFLARDATLRAWKENALKATHSSATVRTGTIGLEVYIATAAEQYFKYFAICTTPLVIATLPAGWYLQLGASTSDVSDGSTPVELDIEGLTMPIAAGDIEVVDDLGIVRGATIAPVYGGYVLSYSQAEAWDATIFDDAGDPILGSVDVDGNVTESSFSTDPDHPRPWLEWPREGRGPQVDFLAGKAKIGQYNITVGDFWSDPTDQATGQITALLAQYNGGNGLRCRLTFTAVSGIRTVAIDGPITTPSLHASFAAYSWGIRDENWRTRKVKAFDRTGTTCVFPRGPLAPYGLLPSGEYLVPAAPVARGTYDADGALQGKANFSFIRIEIGPSVVSPHAYAVLTNAMASAAEYTWDEAAGAYLLKNCTVRWRLAAGPGAWHDLVNMPSYRVSSLAELINRGRVQPLFRTTRATLKLHDSGGGERKYEGLEIINALRLRTVVGDGSDLPADGAEIEVQVVYTGPATDAYPYLYSGTSGDFLKRFYDGEFSTDPRVIRYAADVLATFEEPCNARITKPTDDGLEWLEKNWFQPLAAAPTLDRDGRIAPRRYLLPTPDEELLTLDNATMEATAEFEHPDSAVINEPDFVYFRDVLIDIRDDPTGEISAGDGVWAREIRIEQWEGEDGTGPSHDRFGPKPHEIKTELFRALGLQDGTSASGEATSEIGHILGRERCKQAMDRYLFGAAAWPIHTDRATAAEAVPGSWVECGASWLPDYISALRGMNRVAQVVGIDDDPLSPLRTLMVEDGGDALAPLAQPTVGVAAENAQGGITLPITTVVAGTEALVEYAIALSQPPADSKLWAPAGRLKEADAPGSVDTSQLPAGASVWIGARSFAPNRRPSLRTTPQQVIISETPRLTQVRVHVDEATGDALVTFAPNAFTLGVRVYYAIVATEYLEVTSPTAFVDVDASLGTVTLPDPALIGQVVIVDAEPWDGFTAGAVTGSPGPSVRAYGGLGTGPVINDVDLTDLADGRFEIDVSVSVTVIRLEIWSRTDADPSVAGVPQDAYSFGRYRPQDFPRQFSVPNGTQHVVVRAFDELGQVAEWSGTIATTGGSGGSSGGTTAPTDVPGTPRLELGAMVGGDREVLANWYNTNEVLPIETNWFLNGISIGDINGPLTAGTDEDTTVRAIGDVMSVQLRYVDGALPGPWSLPSAELEVVS